ncbi:MAG: hypothetical protein NC123_05515 [Butyrivibrio sp.]|nr:hypothetical protein [Acetatifactor muris]MCM1558986.1 hypothetical protein [Butyrivibrio sp.]
MRKLIFDRKRYVLPIIHFLLSFLYERSIFLFEEDRDIVLSVPRNYIISDAGERILGYVISKLFAAVLIFFLWHLLFWMIENWKLKKNLRFFLIFFVICLAGVLLLWPNPFTASDDNYITYSYAIRFWPEYWHSAYTSCLYAAMLMVAPIPVFITVFQLIFGVFVVGYLYNRIADSPVLKGKGRYCVFLVFLMPGVYALFTNAYRTELYALLCMFAVAMTAMDIVDGKERGTCSLICSIFLCGFIGVWRTEGIILGFLLFIVQLIFVYKYRPVKSIFLFLCMAAVFVMFSLPQKLGDIKYYGKDYSFINSFPVLKNILSSPDAALSYEGAEQDLAGLEEVVPVEILRYYGMDGYRRYNYANGRKDINQSLAEDETASVYMEAYHRMVLHNLPIYAKTQISMLRRAILLTDREYVVGCSELPVQDLQPWTLEAWDIGREDLEGDAFTGAWMNTEIHRRFSAFVLSVISGIESLLQKVYFYSGVLILIPLFELFLFFREGIRFVKKRKNVFGLAGISFLLLGQAAAIALVMPAGALAYLHAYYYCSFILCLVYISCLRCRKVRENENDGKL